MSNVHVEAVNDLKIADAMLASSPKDEKKNIAVVVSAMGGKPKTTDMLIDSAKHASEGNINDCQALLDKIREKHLTCLQDLLGSRHSEEYRKFESLIIQDLKDIEDLG